MGAVDPDTVDVAVGVDVDARHVVDGDSLEPQPRQDQSAPIGIPASIFTGRPGYRAGVRVAPPLHDPVEIIKELPQTRGDVPPDVSPPSALTAIPGHDATSVAEDLEAPQTRFDGGGVPEVAGGDDAGAGLAVGAVHARHRRRLLSLPPLPPPRRRGGFIPFLVQVISGYVAGGHG